MASSRQSGEESYSPPKMSSLQYLLGDLALMPELQSPLDQQDNIFSVRGAPSCPPGLDHRSDADKGSQASSPTQYNRTRRRILASANSSENASSKPSPFSSSSISRPDCARRSMRNYIMPVQSMHGQRFGHEDRPQPASNKYGQRGSLNAEQPASRSHGHMGPAIQRDKPQNSFSMHTLQDHIAEIEAGLPDQPAPKQQLGHEDARQARQEHPLPAQTYTSNYRSNQGSPARLRSNASSFEPGYSIPRKVVHASAAKKAPSARTSKYAQHSPQQNQLSPPARSSVLSLDHQGQNCYHAYGSKI